MNESLGTRIYKLRKILNLNQKDFSEKINVSQSNLSEIEHDRRNPGSNILFKIHQIFNVNINWLLTGLGPVFLNDMASPESEILKENQALKKEIESLKEELKKMAQQDEKDEAHLKALERRLKELELENMKLQGQNELLQNLLNKKLGLNEG